MPMSTLGTMLDRIADELARSDLTSQINKAVQSAIRHYERKAFYFNEARKTLSTSDGDFDYTTAEFAFLDKMPEIYSVKITVNGSKIPLQERDWEYLDALHSSTTSKGDPTDYAYYGKVFYVWPTPNAARDIVISCIEKLPAASLSATGDTNYWMTDGEELIRSRAVRKLYAEVIKDVENATIWGGHEQEALMALVSETESRAMTGLPRPTQF
jgi:hypothetical protein